MSKTTTSYDVDYFIKKFEATKPESWLVWDYKDGKGRFCALGHCGVTREKHTAGIPEAKALKELFAWTVTSVNNEGTDYFDGPKPDPDARTRILDALYAMKATQLSVVKEVGK